MSDAQCPIATRKALHGDMGETAGGKSLGRKKEKAISATNQISKNLNNGDGGRGKRTTHSGGFFWVKGGVTSITAMLDTHTILKLWSGQRQVSDNTLYNSNGNGGGF